MRHQNPTLCIGFLVGLACLPGHAIAQADASDTTAFIWQGFNHEWERRVVGLWSVPHRVSVLENRIGDERHSHSPEGLLSEASFHFAQSTGVDGDTMHPQGYVARVHSPDLIVQRGTLALAVSDQTQPGPVPSAFTRFEEIIAVETSADAPTHSVALIQGISFRSRCLDDVDDCNSDGLWPYRFLVDLGTCQTVATDTACPVNVEIGRAWTPNRGGVKVIEEKRVSDRMSLDILIHYVVLTGPDDTLSASRMAFENALRFLGAVDLKNAPLLLGAQRQCVSLIGQPISPAPQESAPCVRCMPSPSSLVNTSANW